MVPPPRRSGSAPRSAARPKSGRPSAARFKSRPRQSASESETGESKHGERLQKLLAAAGLGSRRACEELILTGRVEVDRQTVTTIGTRVDPLTQEIRVDGEALPHPRLTYVLVHKIQGVVSTASDPSGRPRVTDMVPPELGRLFPVGRLDMSSEGLILLTNDGELANQLTHPRYGIEKMYHVQVAGQIQQETLDQLEKGIYLAEGVAKVVGVSIKSHHKKSTILEMILDEGRNREIRRLLARVGHKVQRLTRVAMGPVKLGDVPPGAYRLLRPEEIAALHESVQDVPAGKRASKRPGQPRSGSRKLLRQRKSDGSTTRTFPKDKGPVNEAEGKRPLGRFGSTELKKAGTPSRGKPAPGKHSASSTFRKARTVIGEEQPFTSSTEDSPGKSAAGTPSHRGKKPFGAKPRTAKAATGRSSAGKTAYGKSSRAKPTGGKPETGKSSDARSFAKAKRKGKPAFRDGRSKGK